MICFPCVAPSPPPAFFVFFTRHSEKDVAVEKLLVKQTSWRVVNRFTRRIAPPPSSSSINPSQLIHQLGKTNDSRWSDVYETKCNHKLHFILLLLWTLSDVNLMQVKWNHHMTRMKAIKFTSSIYFTEGEGEGCLLDTLCIVCCIPGGSLVLLWLLWAFFTAAPVR